jgi:uncharacterized protein
MSDPVYLPSHFGAPRRGGRIWIVVLALIVIAVLSFSSVVSYYVSDLWFSSLGYHDVFWRSLDIQWEVFAVFTVATFVLLYGWCLILVRANAGSLRSAGTFVFNQRTIHIPLERVLKIGALILSAFIALISGAAMRGNWTDFALYWFHPAGVGGAVRDPILGRGLDFYLFTLPVWSDLSGWLLALAILFCIAAVFSALIAGGRKLSNDAYERLAPFPWRVLSIPVAFLLLVLALREYIARIELILNPHTIFSGITYTDAHVQLGGMMLVAIALILGAIVAGMNFVAKPGVRWVAAAPVPAVICFFLVQIVAWYVGNFIVKPNQLDRERQYITYNIDMTQRAYGLDRIATHEFPASVDIADADASHNQATLQNIRLWDWHALQDTLRQIQEIRTYYDFPDVDIDRYPIDGQTKEVMLAARELSLDKLPESSRNWINEKLIYTHGYGLTMNSVNGFTPEGLPTLMLSNMPIQSAAGAPTVTRPEIYFGQLTDSDVYVKTQQKEFNYPQGETNSLSSYDGTGGIRMGGLMRRVLIAYDRGDVTKVPFSDDIGPDSRLLMRRDIRQRVQALAPFLVFENDPYIVVRDDGTLAWMIDAYTTADTYPYATHYPLGDQGTINYLRNSVKVVIDAYNGGVTFYVFDPKDPVIAAWRGVFPSLFKDESAMPQDLRRHVRYPELLLRMQATVYGLYHMTDPTVFYNREDLWTVATEVGMGDSGEQVQQPMDPNFVLMKLPEGNDVEFIDILPFTPANRNNLIGWIAGRSDGEHYGTSLVYDFPKTRLVDGPMQVEARIDQNAQLSGQLTLWNQQGSHVRRGTLLVIPCGKALLYAEPIYLQAQRSPMPELRLVVLALQDKLAYAPSYEGALQSLFGGGANSLNGSEAGAAPAQTAAGAPASGAAQAEDRNGLIHAAAQDLQDYEQLTAQGRLGEAGQKLDDLKAKLAALERTKQ